MRMLLLTPVKIVGSTNRPAPRSGRLLPPSTQVAPSALAISMYDSIFSNCGRVAIGPIWVSGLASGRRA